MDEHLINSEQVADEAETFEALLSDDLKKILIEVKAELCEIDSELKDVTALTELKKEIVDTFCERNSIEVLPNFKDHLTTPFAITKYLSLIVQQKELIAKIDNALTALLDKNKITWLIYQDFTNTISFTKIIPVNSEEKPQNLRVKYRLDPETDKIIYTIAASNWGWDVTALQLKMILENNTSFMQTTENNDKFTYSISDRHIVINAGGIEITVQKT